MEFSVKQFLGLTFYVNNDYFCDTGNPGPGVNLTTYYTDDPLWDGEGCNSSTSTCCEFNSPPWFCTSLTNPTNDDLEIGDIGVGTGTVEVCAVVGILFIKRSNKAPNVLP